MISSGLRVMLGPRAIKIIKDVRELVLLVPNMLFDMYRVARFSSTGLLGGDVCLHLQGLIIKDYHRIEKGLSLPEPRLGFGESVLVRLDKNLQDYIQSNEFDFHAKCAIEAIYSYAIFHDRSKYVLPIKIDDIVNKWRSQDVKCNEEFNAVEEVPYEDIFFSRDFTFEEFVKSRRSIRNFSSEPLKYQDVKKAVSIARYAPSVCNRQAVKVYYFTDKNLMKRMLKEQNGNAGFGHTCFGLCVIVYDLSFFEGAGERNQGFVDGGIFLSHLLLAFHSLNIGACPLNWSAKLLQDCRLRKIINLPAKEVIVSLVGVGVPAKSILIARSPRRPVEEVLIIAKSD